MRSSILALILAVGLATACSSGGGSSPGGRGGSPAGGSTGGGGVTAAAGETGAGGGTGAAGAAGSGGASGRAGAPATGGAAGATTRDGGPPTDAGSSWTVVPCGASPPSCAGLPHVCGPNGDGDCCQSDLVPGGNYLRDNLGEPATVGTYCLDKYEITVGRFRNFLMAYPGAKPSAGAGNNPNDPADTGWAPTWTASLPADQSTLARTVATYPDCSQYENWATSPDLYDDMPMNCITWYLAYAFCAWDGGWLPTRVQWDYAARGGPDQRYYPWSSPPSDQTLDPSYADYDCYAEGGTGCHVNVLEVAVGSRPKGDGRFGQSDLLGNVMEWLQDWKVYSNPQVPCVDCADLTSGSFRLLRGGSAESYKQNLGTNADENNYPPTETWAYIGARCARAR
ncbi:MAG TPA: SUMF1/EgtB/PvdO family nonheme iron enzyme [Polyangia bacterium]